MSILTKMRGEFAMMIDRCGCSRASVRGKCTPSKCFPTLYNSLYPKGGFNGKSNMARMRKKELDKLSPDKKCSKCGLDIIDGSPKRCLVCDV